MLTHVLKSKFESEPGAVQRRNTSGGFVALLVVCSISILCALFVFTFFESEEYLLRVIQEDTIHDTSRIVVRTCAHLYREKVYAGLSHESMVGDSFSKNVFTLNIKCSVYDSSFESVQFPKYAGKIRLEITPSKNTTGLENTTEEYVSTFSITNDGVHEKTVRVN